MTTLIIEDFKDIKNISKQIIRSELHAWNKPKIIMSKENIEKLKIELKKYEIDIPEPLTFNCIIGAIPIGELK